MPPASPLADGPAAPPPDSLGRDLRRAIAAEPLLPLALLTVVAALLRASLLDMPMRLDEATTYNEFLSQPWRVMLGRYVATNNHPLFSILAKAATDLLGSDPWVIRLPAFLAGVLLVPVTYFASLAIGSRPVAWFASAGVAVAAPMVLFSANGRGYTIVACLALLQWLAVRDALERGRTSSWVLVALLGALGVFTHLTMAFAYAGSVVWALVWMARHRALARSRLAPLAWSGAASVVLAIALHLPIIRGSGLAALTENQNVSARTTEAFVVGVSELVPRIGLTWSTGLPGWLAIVVGILAAIGLLAGTRGRPAAAYPLVAVVTLVVIIATTFRVPPPRSTLYLLPLVLIALGELVSRVAAALPRRATPAVWGIAVVPFALLGAAHLSDQPVRRMAETGWVPEAPAIHRRLHELVQPGDAVAAIFLMRDVLRYHYLHEGEGRGPLVPPDCPAAPNNLYFVVRQGTGLAPTLRDVRLPPEAGQGAVLLETIERYEIWRAPVPPGMPCGVRPPS